MQRILVIDDNPDLREVMKAVIEQAGYEVEVAEDGQAALAKQRARPADGVITDIFMPNQDGIETIAQFRKAFPRLKLIAMSGGARKVNETPQLLAARELGANAILLKPFDREELLRVIRRVLDG